MSPIKFSCRKDDICSAISNVSKAVSPKSTIAALEGIRLKLSVDTLELTGYDLEIGITTEIETESTDAGEIVLNSRLFSEITRRMPGDFITYETDENLNMRISCGSTEYHISAISAEEYPVLPEVDRNRCISLNQETLKSMINQTNYAVSLNDAKPILTGELFDINEDGFNMVAIDGYRLAIRHENMNCGEKYHFVVPSKALSEASRLLKEEAEEDCKIYVSDRHIMFEINGYTIFTRLLEGEFHNYRSSVPVEYKTEVTVNTMDIVHSLERCALLINEKNKAPIRCRFEDSAIKISCRTGIGSIEDSIKCEISGENVIIGFNNKYLLDALRSADTDKVKIQMTGSNRAVKIVPPQGDHFTAIVMPIQIKG